MAIIFETTFSDANCAEWTQSDGLSDAAVCQVGDGISGGGGWTTTNGSEDQITSAANYPGGGGGKGFRHYFGDLGNNNGGGLTIFPTSNVNELYIRFYIRYSTNSSWTFTPPHPQYTKEIYWEPSNSHVIGFQNNIGLATQGAGGTIQSSDADGDWQNVMGGDNGDGLWHWWEFHLQQNLSTPTAGTVEAWLDGTKIINRIGDVNLGTTAYGGFLLGSNQATGNGMGATDGYRDFDDIVVATTGPIGPVTPASTATRGSMSLR